MSLWIKGNNVTGRNRSTPYEMIVTKIFPHVTNFGVDEIRDDNFGFSVSDNSSLISNSYQSINILWPPYRCILGVDLQWARTSLGADANMAPSAIR